MAKDLSVDLDTTSGVLIVSEKSVVIHKADTINWQLNNNAASGAFNALDATPPGFKWVPNPTPPPAGAFNSPTLGNNNKKLTLDDLDPAPGGPWAYQLAATINGKVYLTGAVKITGGGNDPTIENR